ncbi:MAG TPA: hypothetical protein VJL29_12090, partial [Thermoguttaceae bacterium]|nr:hypothetical protein [Thermoguttaceae bacterium]
VRCYLEPFHRAETEQYVRAQVDAAAGGPNSCFAPEAAVAVHQATEGVPRLVNQLCDHALLLAYADGSRAIDTAAVETAWADLQQLPAPWTGDAADHGPRNVIEFGGLDDDAISGEERGATKAASLELLSEDEDESTIDELQRTLDELQEPSVSAGNAELFHPLETIGPEADLALDEPRGPFAEPFSEEEEIVQPYRETAAPERAESRKSPAADVRRTPSLSTAATRRERPCAQGDGTWPGSDLIVFDDEAESPEPEVTPPTVVGRSSQYRHLFAKLRQGC